MSIKDGLLDLVELSYQEKLSFVRDLSEAERAASGAPDRWSAKDLIAHVTTWEFRMMDNIEAARRGEPLPTRGDDDHENAQIFADHRDTSWADARRMIDDAYHRITEFVQAASETDLADTEKSPWQDKRAIWRGIAGNTASHALLHLSQYYAEHGQRDRALRMQETVAEKIIALDDSPAGRGVAIYNLACFYAIAGYTQKAITRLAEALRLYPDLTDWSKQDPDFTSIRDEPEYQALYA
jgi:tetratricopeptide (TPR) repeat protein